MERCSPENHSLSTNYIYHFFGITVNSLTIIDTDFGMCYTPLKQFEQKMPKMIRRGSGTVLSDARHSQIVKYLETHQSASVQDLARDLYTSPSTIRRDLSQLETMGFLRRVHGGAVLTTGSTFDTPASLRRTQQLAEKQKIAELASRFLSSSSTYFFDSSSTAAIFSLKLLDYLDISIATNGLGILSNLQSSSNLSVFSCGGFLRSPYDEFTGNITQENITQMHADIFFFSCAGLSAEQGATELSDENVAVKRAFYRNSKQHILLCDSTKFDQHFFFTSFPLKDIDYVITDAPPSNARYAEILGDRLIYE